MSEHAQNETPQNAEITENSENTENTENGENTESAESGVPAFADLGIDGRVLAAISDLGYENPSPIQAQTIPLLLSGRDVVGLAQTGTGKTAAFAVPALSRLAELADVNGPANTPQILVLAPTRELALQVAEAFTTYAKHIKGVTVLPVYGGAPYGPQLSGLRRGAQVVVGTPGRVIDHLSKGSLDLSNLQYMVLDEADEMLRMGFAEEVDQILSATPDQKQTALFSATMPRAIQRISGKYLNNPVEVSVAAKNTTAGNIRQRYMQVTGSWKLEALTRILETEEHDGVIAFVRTRNATEELATKLNARGFRAVALSGDVAQNQREKTVDNLRQGRVDILVATDVAARGLDVERISHVINYDIPHDTEGYVHRIGRTGRAGRSGDAVLFMTPREKYLLRAIEKATRQTVEQMNMPSVADVNNSRLGRFSTQITETLSAGDLDVFRGLIDSYVSENDVNAEDVAAALAKMAQGGRPLLAEEQDMPPARMERGGREDRGDRDGRGSRGPQRGPAEGNATYRISLGRQDRVQPGNIVGALANEAGLRSNQIGHIDIRSNHALVELPADLTSQQWDALGNTTINGRPIEIQKDSGRPTNAEREGKPFRSGGGGYKGGHKGGYGGHKGGGKAGFKAGRKSFEKPSRDRY
ncbi:DEAD/DEAH box helicase [Citricoccus nitrophenolicus]|uniref:ATP-dependent RNA helicase DeaD n=1 Tax=Citricoccus muralis TaxID=169134 RepID=A0A3D9LER6_9MICC|nr:DEAD/DEAH box helicase [Citricoccus muralis]REE03927.1 ATP-dependent RNA helicase CsdA [Citricoccus muralis]